MGGPGSGRPRDESPESTRARLLRYLESVADLDNIATPTTGEAGAALGVTYQFVARLLEEFEAEGKITQRLEHGHGYGYREIHLLYLDS